MPHLNINQYLGIYIEMFIAFCSIAMASASNSSPSKGKSSSETDLSIINTEDEMCTDTTKWTSAKQEKLQHMTEFHKEYQRIFGEKGSICTIMKEKNLKYESPNA